MPTKEGFDNWQEGTDIILCVKDKDDPDKWVPLGKLMSITLKEESVNEN